MDCLQQETTFLILLFLEEHLTGDLFKVIVDFVEQNGMLPKKKRVLTNNDFQSFDLLKRLNKHIGYNHLTTALSKLLQIQDERITDKIKNIKTFLGAGKQSLLANPDEEDGKKKWSIPQLQTNLKNPLIRTKQLDRPNIYRAVEFRRTHGLDLSPESLPSVYMKNMKFQRRFAVHASAVFCVIYDRTGNYIFTGSDDGLIKVFGVSSGRLLWTYRGHTAEVVDIACNYENTLLASGAMDKTVRIWCLRSAACLAVLTGHTNILTGVQFLPLLKDNTYRYLVSTGDDASVCFWRYTDQQEPTISGKPMKFVERSRIGAKIKCLTSSPGGGFVATGSTDHVIRIFSLLGRDPEKIAELESHTADVDSIEYSHSDLRFASASKDGTLRIWRNNEHKMRDNITIKLKPLPSSEVRSGGGTPVVDTLSWSYDDSKIYVTVSDFSIRSYDSRTGTSLNGFKGHSDCVYCIEPCPFNSNLVITGSHDGYLKLWDMDSLQCLLTHYNIIEGQGFGAIYDCKWRPNDLSFTATDSHGNMLRFSFGDDPRLTSDKIPEELFFHTDYQATTSSPPGDNRVILDQVHQIQPHLLIPPYLVTFTNNPYAADIQTLVPGRELLTNEQNTALSFLLDTGRQVVDPIGIPTPTFVLPEDVHQTDHNETFEADTDLDVSHPSTSNNSNNANTSSSSTHRRSSISQQAPVNLVRKTDERRTLCNSYTYKHDQTAYDNLYQFEYSEFIKELTQNNEHQGDSVLGIRRRRAGQRSNKNQSQTNNEDLSQQQARNRLTTRALYDTDNEEEPSEYRHDSPPPRSHSREDDARSVEDVHSSDPEFNIFDSPSDSSISDYSDWEADTSQQLRPPTRTRARTSSPVIIPAHPVHPASGSRTSRIVRSSPRKNQTTSTTRTKSSTSSIKSRSARAKRRAKRMAARFTENLVDESDSQLEQMEVARRPPEWLIAETPQRQPYVPQIGDEVVYMKQGHVLYLEEVAKQQLYTPSKEQPWNKVPNLQMIEFARIVNIKYEVKEPSYTRIAWLKLARIYRESGRTTGTLFTVKYHDMAGVVDFIILRQFYDRSVDYGWSPGERFRSIIDEKWWTGVIKEISPIHPQSPESSFLSISVLWEDQTEDRLSPWDLEPLPTSDLIQTGDDITEQEYDELIYQPSESDWPHGRDETCERVANCIQQLMGYSVAEQFCTPVDTNLYPFYYIEIPYSVNLSLILARAKNQYYRRTSAMIYDVRMIQHNTEAFNLEGSVIIKHARIVSDLLLKIIEDETCRNAQSIYNTMDLDDEYYTSTDQPNNTNECTWRETCIDLIDELINMDDAAPFRQPVSAEELPDYCSYVRCPMDFGTIQTNLTNDIYHSLDEVISDIRLIFSNSRAYNTNKRSRVFIMTVRLSALVEERIKILLTEFRDKKRGRKKSSTNPPTINNNTKSTAGPSSCSYIEVERKTYSTRGATGSLRKKTYQDMVDVSEIDTEDEERPSTSKKPALTNGATNSTKISTRMSSHTNGHKMKKKAVRSPPPDIDSEDTVDEDTDIGSNDSEADSAADSYDQSTEIEEAKTSSPKKLNRKTAKRPLRKRRIETSDESSAEEEDEPVHKRRLKSNPASRQTRNSQPNYCDTSDEDTTRKISSRGRPIKRRTYH